VVRGRGRADAARDVVVAGENVGHERPEHVERRAVTHGALQLHVVFDLIERHVARALDHHLAALAPGLFGQLTQRVELGQLRLIAGVGEPAGAQAVAERERDVVLAHDVADLVEVRVHRVLLLCTSIHLASSEPPRLTMPISALHERQVLAAARRRGIVK
jgi:hypothetical protein